MSIKDKLRTLSDMKKAGFIGTGKYPFSLFNLEVLYKELESIFGAENKIPNLVKEFLNEEAVTIVRVVDDTGGASVGNLTLKHFYGIETENRSLLNNWMHSCSFAAGFGSPSYQVTRKELVFPIDGENVCCDLFQLSSKTVLVD